MPNNRARAERPPGRGVAWRDRETRDLLDIWGDPQVQHSLATSKHNIHIFQRIAQQMTARGHRRTAIECRTKTKAMRYEFKRVQQHNRGTGNERATCPYFDELQRILRVDVSIQPGRVARTYTLPAPQRGRGAARRQTSTTVQEDNPEEGPSAAAGTPAPSSPADSDITASQDTDPGEGPCTRPPSVVSGATSESPTLGEDEDQQGEEQQRDEEGDADYGERPLRRPPQRVHARRQQSESPPPREESPERRLVQSRRRLRRGAVTAEIGRELLEHCAAEAENQQQAQAAEQEWRQDISDQMRLDREAFLLTAARTHEAYLRTAARTHELMAERTEVLRRMTDLRLQQQGDHVCGRCQAALPPLHLSSSAAATSRSQ